MNHRDIVIRLFLRPLNSMRVEGYGGGGGEMIDAALVFFNKNFISCHNGRRPIREHETLMCVNVERRSYKYYRRCVHTLFYE